MQDLKKFIKRYNGFKIRAGALSFVVFILMQITILLSVYIIHTHNKGVLFNYKSDLLQQELNIESAMLLLKEGCCDFMDSLELDIFEDSSSFVKIEKQNWGIFEVVDLNAKSKHIKNQRKGLFGKSFDSESCVSIYLADKNKVLSLAGNTVINGSCFLPALGYRTVNIEGEIFRGCINIDSVRQSEPLLPTPVDSSFQIILDLFKKCVIGDWINCNQIENNNQIDNSFCNATKIIYADTPLLHISNISISGKVMLFSPSTIIIEENVNLDKIIVVAKKIVVGTGVSGNAQFFASDSLLFCGAKMEYPTVACIVNSEEVQAFMSFSYGSELNGCALLWNTKSNELYPPKLCINKGAQINGQVYCSGITNHKGKVWGQLITSKFIHRTNGAIYDNFLYNASVITDGFPDGFVGISFILPNNRKQLIEWLE